MLEPQTAAMTVEKDESGSMLLTLVSWLFLMGSLLFQIDAILELIEGFSIHVLLHLSAGLLFTVGSVLFVMHDARQK
jgi:hypothetical protein